MVCVLSVGSRRWVPCSVWCQGVVELMVELEDVAVRYSGEGLLVADDLVSLACVMPEQTSEVLPKFATKTVVHLLREVPESEWVSRSVDHVAVRHGQLVCDPLHFYLSIPGATVHDRMDSLPSVVSSTEFSSVCGEVTPDVMVVTHGDVDGSRFVTSYTVTRNHGYDFVILDTVTGKLFPAPEYLGGAVPTVVRCASGLLNSMAGSLCPPEFGVDNPLPTTGDRDADLWASRYVDELGYVDLEGLLVDL